MRVRMPEDLPPLEVESAPEQMAAPVTLFEATSMGQGGEGAPATNDAFLLAVDQERDVVVSDLRVKDRNHEAGWIIYRAERIPTIHVPTPGFEETGG